MINTVEKLQQRIEKTLFMLLLGTSTIVKSLGHAQINDFALID